MNSELDNNLGDVYMSLLDIENCKELGFHCVEHIICEYCSECPGLYPGRKGSLKDIYLDYNISTIISSNYTIERLMKSPDSIYIGAVISHIDKKIVIMLQTDIDFSYFSRIIYLCKERTSNFLTLQDILNNYGTFIE